MPVEPVRLSPQLAAVASELDAASRRAEAVTSGLTAEQLVARPFENRWSIAEQLEHLRLSAEVYFPEMKRLMDEARARGLTSTKPYRRDFTGWMLAWSLEPPVRMRFRTTAPFEPVAVGNPTTLLARFLDVQRHLAATLDEAQGLPLDRIKIASSFNPRMKYNLYSLYRITLAHERRHLWLAERVREALRRG